MLEVNKSTTIKRGKAFSAASRCSSVRNSSAVLYTEESEIVPLTSFETSMVSRELSLDAAVLMRTSFFSCRDDASKDTGVAALSFEWLCVESSFDFVSIAVVPSTDVSLTGFFSVSIFPIDATDLFAFATDASVMAVSVMLAAAMSSSTLDASLTINSVSIFSAVVICAVFVAAEATSSVAVSPVVFSTVTFSPTIFSSMTSSVIIFTIFSSAVIV
mmetsp:Transcript_35342/g.81919  ORF Transcript_35342/g.81919 Transcript_35342/m.81919 type:complete len:216 (+) Transcript_35342:723-1370(+)